eukprot:m.134954 g.134954  ORF g.134954 m.134954 type:complete len:267 (+) comp16930_c0_seq2:1205-2005(+)
MAADEKLRPIADCVLRVLPWSGKISTIMEGVVGARPAPPVVGKVTGTSIQLYWEDYGAKLKGKVTYAVQESCGSVDVGNGGSDALPVADWGTVYTGSGNATTVQGLTPLSQYRYRLRLAHDDETGPWSPVVTVATTKQASTVTSADLIAAAKAGSSQRVEELLSASDNLDIDSPDSFGRSPLMIASQQGHAAVVAKLLAAGANVGHTNGAGKSRCAVVFVLSCLVLVACSLVLVACCLVLVACCGVLVACCVALLFWHACSPSHSC